MNKKLVIFLILLLNLIKLSPAFASEINFTSIPSEVMRLTDFEVYSTFSGLDANVNYSVKALGGADFYDVQTYNNEKYLPWNALWDDFPKFSTDGNGSGSIIIKCRFKEDTAISSNQFIIRIRREDTTKNIDSETVSINVLPQPTETPKPTSQPTLTETPDPTKTPTPTNAPSATKTPTPKPTQKLANSPTPLNKVSPTLASKDEINTNVLGEQKTIDSPPSSASGAVSTQSTLISGAKISLILGLLFCGTAVIIFAKRVNNLKQAHE